MEANHINLQVSWLESVNFYVKFCPKQANFYRMGKMLRLQSVFEIRGLKMGKKKLTINDLQLGGDSAFLLVCQKKRRFFLSNNVPFVRKNSCNFSPGNSPSQDRKILVFFTRGAENHKAKKECFERRK